MNDILNDLISTTTLPLPDLKKKKKISTLTRAETLMGKDSVGVKGARPTTGGWPFLENYIKLYPFCSK